MSKKVCKVQISGLSKFFFKETHDDIILKYIGLEAGVAPWVYARVICERPQMLVQSHPQALIRSLKQAPIDGNCLR